MKLWINKTIFKHLKDSTISKCLILLLSAIIIIIALTLLNFTTANHELINSYMTKDFENAKSMSKNLTFVINEQIEDNQNLVKYNRKNDLLDYINVNSINLMYPNASIYDIGFIDYHYKHLISKNKAYSEEIKHFFTHASSYGINLNAQNHKTFISSLIKYKNHYFINIVTPVYDVRNYEKGYIYKVLDLVRLYKDLKLVDLGTKWSDFFLVSPEGEWVYSQDAPFLVGKNFKDVINQKTNSLAYNNYASMARGKEFSNYHKFLIVNQSGKVTNQVGDKIVAASPVRIMGKFIMSCCISDPTFDYYYLQKRILFQVGLLLIFAVILIIVGTVIYKNTLNNEKQEIILREKLENSQRIKSDNEKTQFEVIKGLVTLIEMKDTYTGGHSERVMKYSIGVARYMGYDKERLNIVRYAAILHDIGKIGVSESVLNKHGKLTDEEFAEIKKHPYTGYISLKDINILNSISEIILQHHERIDGKGYPSGLKGYQINEIAKILCVCDAYDAMTSNRVYRKMLTMEEAMSELEKNSGTQFDSYIVEKFKEYIKSNPDVDGEPSLE